MKLSNISVIFIIIVIPLILLLSYYISLQTDTMNMQTDYTSKQLRATKEAVDAFEINTVEWNEAYSENADSKRRDVMASINTFTKSFANSIGISGTNKETILAYVPAIACTLYDGYYIYSPAEVKEVIKDKNGVAVFLKEELVGTAITDYEYVPDDKGKLLYEYDSTKGGSSQGVYKYTDKNGNEIEKEFTLDSAYAKSKYEHILKPFSTYSARYNNGKAGNQKTDIIINYTLDNFITIYGTVKGTYVVKSGYLIDGDNIPTVQPETLTEKIAWRWNESNTYTCQEYPYVYAEDNTKVYFDNSNVAFRVSSRGIRSNIGIGTTNVEYKKLIKDGNIYYQALNNYDINADGSINNDDIVAGRWYRNKNDASSRVGSHIVSSSIYKLNKDFSAINYYRQSKEFTNWVTTNLSDIQIKHIQGVKDEDKPLYGNLDDNLFNFEDPEFEDSIIMKHKAQVIKQTLISNLNQAITSYSRHNSEQDYQLPILKESDWDHVLRNVSIITFLQNIPIGLKYYNNYAVATSTNNKEFANPNEIYLTRNGDTYYHLPFCSKLEGDPIIGYRSIDYVVKSYNEEQPDGTINTMYYYKHTYKIDTEYFNNEACYYCLVQRDLYSSEELSDDEKENHNIAYKTALARERYRKISQ